MDHMQQVYIEYSIDVDWYFETLSFLILIYNFAILYVGMDVNVNVCMYIYVNVLLYLSISFACSV